MSGHACSKFTSFSGSFWLPLLSHANYFMYQHRQKGLENEANLPYVHPPPPPPPHTHTQTHTHLLLILLTQLCLYAQQIHPVLPRTVFQDLAGPLELSAAEEASAALSGSGLFRVFPVAVTLTAGSHQGLKVN